MKSVPLQVGAAVLAMITVWLGTPQQVRAEGGVEEVVATAYTCEVNPANRMHPCGPLRWGGDVHGQGMACPVAWRGRTFDVPSWGILTCDDTQEIDVLHGLPHVDIRVPTLAEAQNWGMRRITLRPPVKHIGTEAAAIERAHELAPGGDTATAMARALTFARAHEHFPSLVEGVALPPEYPVWVVTIWLPPDLVSIDAVARPDPEAEIAAAYFVFDARNSAVLADGFVSSEVLHTMGWISQDTFDFGGQ